MRRIARAGLAAAASIALTGCGGGGPSGPVSGESLFEEQQCGSCHTFAAAEATSTVGPDLDAKRYTARDVEQALRRVGVGMPTYEGMLTDAEIRMLSRYVAENGAARLP